MPVPLTSGLWATISAACCQSRVVYLDGSGTCILSQRASSRTIALLCLLPVVETDDDRRPGECCDGVRLALLTLRDATVGRGDGVPAAFNADILSRGLSSRRDAALQILCACNALLRQFEKRRTRKRCARSGCGRLFHGLLLSTQFTLMRSSLAKAGRQGKRNKWVRDPPFVRCLPVRYH